MWLPGEEVVVVVPPPGIWKICALISLIRFKTMPPTSQYTNKPKNRQCKPRHSEVHPNY